jgi:hypothetical protein
MSALQAQSGDSIIAVLKSINHAIIKKPCGASNTAAISKRAMNIFLADKTGYLSNSTDLSMYTNYVTLNPSQGKISVNHNFQQASGIDEPIKKLFNIGIDIALPNSFAANFLDGRFDNGLGLTASYKWLGKVTTRFADCSVLYKKQNQKQTMDALRTAITHAIEIEINNKVKDFEKALSDIDSTELPGQQQQIAKSVMQQNFL